MNKKPTADQLSNALNLTNNDVLVKPSSSTPVNHPNFIPDVKKGNQADATEHHGKNEFDSKGKPPIGSNVIHGDLARTRHLVSRSVSHDGSRGENGSDARVKGSVGSFGSSDSKSYEEEVVISYLDEAVDIDEQGAGNKIAAEKTRLVILSSKMRNAMSIRHALQPNVVLVQYKYDNSTLDGILGLVGKSLGSRKCESIAFILSCSGLSIQLCGKEEKLQVLNRENVTENGPVREFFQTLVNNHMDKSSPGVRLDFLACNLLLHSDGRSIDKEIEAYVGIHVGLHKDLAGTELPKLSNEEGSKAISVVGDLYFKLEKLRGWSGQQQQTLAGFEKIQTVGKGAYGAAVLYKKKDDDFLVILKEINMHDLNAAERQMALNEVNILAMLEHPNIISYFDSFEEDGVIIIEMEYADGGTLAQFLANLEKPLEEREILVKFKQIADAIRHIHEHNVLHRDLKTANIFLTKEGVVKVGDFGISKMMSTANKGANTVLGTPYYISPEMCEGKPYKDKSDIWALGCILYEMACRQKTFEGSNLPALVNKIMKGQFAPVKGNYSQEFKDLVMMMLSQDPDQRPSSHDLVYVHIPKLEAEYEEVTSDNEEESTSRPGSEYTKKRTRTILYYFDSASADLTPVELNPKVKIKTTAVGPDHVIVVTTESQVYTWGEGSKGQLGHGDTVSLEKPKLVEALTGKCIARACCGEGFSVFTSDRGIVLTCGDGSKGCLGHGDWNDVCRPRLIESLLSVDVISVDCGTEHVVVVGSEGEIFSWGNGTDGKLGLGNEENHCQPVRVTVSEPVLMRNVFCGIDGTMFLTDVGCVFACGSNRDNKLALNNRRGFIAAMRNIFTRCEVEGQKVPTSARSLAQRRVIDISMGRHHTAVIVDPGKVYTFGRNVEGQLGTEGTKPANAPVEVKAMAENNIVRIQCGDHYTVASTDKSEIYYWGLRFKDPYSQIPDEQDSRSSANDDLRIESVTPRQMGYSRQPSLSTGNDESTPRNVESHMSCDQDEAVAEKDQKHVRHNSSTSGLSIVSCKDGNEGLTDREDYSSPQRQTSVDSSLSGLTDSGYTGDMSAGSEIATRTGFRPLSSVPRRSLSASSRENPKEKDKDKEKEADLPKDDSEIIFPPDHLMRIMPQEELLTLSSFFCHGENLFIQLETTAPPPRRKSRKKRGFRKRYSGNALVVPFVNNGTSASSREGGDEYSSEASEMDTQGTVPTWIKKELAMSEELDANDGNLPDDTSDLSDQDRTHATFDTSMTSIQINRDLTACKVPPDKNLTPRNSGFLDPSTSSSKKTSPRDHRVRSISTNSTESEVENSNQSDSSTKDIQLRSEGRSKTMLVTNSTKVGRSIVTGARAKSASTKTGAYSRPRYAKGHNMALKEQLSARGFVSDVTVKRREEALLGELHTTREEKILAERRIKELEQEYQRKQEMLRQEAEQRALEREKALQDQISKLQQQLQTQNSQLQDNQKTVQVLQDQLSKVQKKKNKLGGARGVTSESKVCCVQ